MNFLSNRSAYFFVGACLVITIFAITVWWLLKPNYAPLIQQDSKISQSDALNVLNLEKIPYIINNNVIEVENSNLGDARLALAHAGLSNPETVGFEIFNKTDYGMSDFAQKINFQRAIEGELARSIMAMDGIKYARVHITPKSDSIYANDKETAKAAVIMQVKNGYKFPKDSLIGIQNLVASSVDGLLPVNVSLLNEQGQIISPEFYENSSMSSGKEIELAANIENKVKNILLTVI